MSRKLFHTFFILILITGLVVTERPSAVHAAGPWYVSPSGDDGNDCLNPTSPCATINGAIGKASSGDMVNVAEGTYTGSGPFVVTIAKSVMLSGGWNSTFTTNNGVSTIDGQNTRGGVNTAFFEFIFATMDRFVIQNGRTTGGGGINVNFDTLTLNNSAVINNVSTENGGGILMSGILILNNTTISGNKASGTGGGIWYSFGEPLTLNNSTIANNTASEGGGVNLNSSTAVLQNSIVAGNLAGIGPDCLGTIVTSDHNIIGNTSDCAVTAGTGDQFNINPLISAYPLGKSAYHALLAGSPAIDAGDPTTCLPIDQRAVSRGTSCDIGAYEYLTPGTASSIGVSAGSNQRVQPGLSFSIPFVIFVVDDLGSPVSGITVTFVAPASGPSGTFSNTGSNTSMATSDSSGLAIASVFTADNQDGNFEVTATADGLAGSATFVLGGFWYVAPSGDDTNICTSAAAPCLTINAASGKAAWEDTIKVSVGTYTGTGGAVVQLEKSITVSGGWDASFSDQSGMSVIDAQFARQGVNVSSNTLISMDHFAIQNGSSFEGGGLYNSGTLTLSHTVVKDSISSSYGGGIDNEGILTLNNSAVINNRSDSQAGGGILNRHTASLTMNNSTISGNSAPLGGGIINVGTLLINNSTITNNTATQFEAGGLNMNSGTAFLQNTILAGNIAASAPDCLGTVGSLGHNLIGNTTNCNLTEPSDDLLNVDPLLGSLQDNGGPTLTHALLPGSPAIDAGHLPDCTDQNENPLTTDQRGVVRPQGERCDMGAFEFEGQPLPPANDNFANAELITSLPFFATVSTSSAGLEPGEPLPFFYRPKTAWYTFTPTEAMTLAVDSFFNVNVYSASGPGFDNLSFLGSSLDNGGSFSFLAEAGHTHYLQVDGVGAVLFSLLQIIPPPANDNLANAKEILSLPFSDTVDSTNATLEPDEPSFCGSTPQTQSVWYSFTPEVDVVVSADMFGSSFSDTNLSLFQQVGPGFDGLSLLNTACFGGSIIFTAQAGITYYLQAESDSSGGGDLHVNLHELTPLSNDKFASAETIAAIPFSTVIDVSGATSEPNEPQFCNFMDRTAWYTFIPPATMTIRADTLGGISATVNIYRATGPEITDLQFQGCASPNSPTNFLAEAGQTYYLQAGPAFGEIGTMQFTLTELSTITGRVTDELTGAPLSGDALTFASVTLLRVCGDNCLEPIASQGVDSNSTFRFDGYFGDPLPTGTYKIEVSTRLYQTEQFGPFEYGGVNLDVGDLPIDALPLIGSIQGRLVDAATGSPVSGTFTPSVQLYRCTDGNCFEFVNSQTPDSQGRFRFETDQFGNPLPVGTYQVLGFADQYHQAQTQLFEVGEGMHRSVGNLRITSFPVRFSDVQPCSDLPASGGECSYSVRIWNGLSTRLRGDAWSVVNGTLPDSFAAVTDFEIPELQVLNLEKGRSKVFSFRFNVPGTTSPSEAFICTRLFAGQGINFRFNTIGFRDLFCIFRSAGGFSITSPQEAITLTQTDVTAASTGTEVEPNNSCLTAQDVGAVPFPYVLDGNLDSTLESDIDFYRFSGTAGTLITLDHEGQATGKGTLGDPFLGVFDSNCNLIDLNDDFNSLNSHLEITIPSDGVFILGATVCCDSGFVGGGNGSYQLSVAPVQLIGSIAGRVTDAISGVPLSGDVEPFAFVRLLQCDDFGCNDVKSQAVDSEGRFSFATDSNGAPLRAGNYQIVVSANQYMAGQTEQFAVGEAENYDIGDFALSPFPIVFSEIQPCSVPSEGGLCDYSVKITNGLATRLSGKAWSVASGSATGSFAGFTVFQTDLGRELRLDPGQSTTLRFRFHVPGTVADGATICALSYVGQNPSPFFHPVGLELVFCLIKGDGGFTLLSAQDAQATSQQVQTQIREIHLPDPLTLRK